MTLLTEQDIEDVTLEMLQELGYNIVHGPDIAPDSGISKLMTEKISVPFGVKE